MPDAETAIELLPDLDGGLGPGEPVEARTQLQVMFAEADRVVMGHGAQVAEAANLPGVHRGIERSPGGPEVIGGDSKAGVEAGCRLRGHQASRAATDDEKVTLVVRQGSAHLSSPWLIEWISLWTVKATERERGMVGPYLFLAPGAFLNFLREAYIAGSSGSAVPPSGTSNTKPSTYGSDVPSMKAIAVSA